MPILSRDKQAPPCVTSYVIKHSPKSQQKYYSLQGRATKKGLLINKLNIWWNHDFSFLVRQYIRKKLVLSNVRMFLVTRRGASYNTHECEFTNLSYSILVVVAHSYRNTANELSELQVLVKLRVVTIPLNGNSSFNDHSKRLF